MSDNPRVFTLPPGSCVIGEIRKGFIVTPAVCKELLEARKKKGHPLTKKQSDAAARRAFEKN